MDAAPERSGPDRRDATGKEHRHDQHEAAGSRLPTSGSTATSKETDMTSQTRSAAPRDSFCRSGPSCWRGCGWSPSRRCCSAWPRWPPPPRRPAATSRQHRGQRRPGRNRDHARPERRRRRRRQQRQRRRRQRRGRREPVAPRQWWQRRGRQRRRRGRSANGGMIDLDDINSGNNRGNTSPSAPAPPRAATGRATWRSTAARSPTRRRCA